MRWNCVICALSMACAEGDQIGWIPPRFGAAFAFAGALALGAAFGFAGALDFVMAPLSPTPDAREPGLLFDGQSGRPVVVLQLLEARHRQVAPPGVQVMVCAVAPAVPT